MEHCQPKPIGYDTDEDKQTVLDRESKAYTEIINDKIKIFTCGFIIGISYVVILKVIYG